MVFKSINEEVSHSSPIPLYYQVFQILHKEMETGKYKPGDYLPTEAELQKRFNVSRATVRQAISELVYMGLLERRRSKGTIVSSGRLETSFHHLASFTNEIMDSKRTITTKILQFKRIQAPEEIAEILEIPPEELIVMMERLRYIESRPVAIEKWYAPLKYLPGITKNMFKEAGKEQSTYYILMQYYNLQITQAVDTISPVGAEPREARLLGIKPLQPALLRTRVSYSSYKRPVTYSSGIYLIKLKFPLG
ncbi:MAG: GntR family transcriptional regulator [Spirochaetota bacterium]